MPKIKKELIDFSSFYFYLIALILKEVQAAGHPSQ